MNVASSGRIISSEIVTQKTQHKKKISPNFERIFHTNYSWEVNTKYKKTKIRHNSSNDTSNNVRNSTASVVQRVHALEVGSTTSVKMPSDKRNIR